MKMISYLPLQKTVRHVVEKIEFDTFIKNTIKEVMTYALCENIELRRHNTYKNNPMR